MTNSINYSFIPKNELGTNLFGFENQKTGYSFYTTIADEKLQYPSLVAFAGARYSRSNLSIYDLLKEIKDSKKNAQKRLAAIFTGYGHASVGDMALLFAYVQNVPILSAFNFFYSSAIGSGQDRSSRYQDYTNAKLLPITSYLTLPKKDTSIINEYNELGDISIGFYKKYLTILSKEYIDFYKPGEDKSAQGALKSRVFDTARYFLLTGFPTSFAYITSSREWARIIADLRSYDSILTKDIGDGLFNLFVPNEEIQEKYNFIPEAPDLIRYCEASMQVKNNLNNLYDYLTSKTNILSIPVKIQKNIFKNQSVDLISRDIGPSEMMLTQYILTIFPQLDSEKLYPFIRHLSDQQKKAISKIIFSNHTHQVQLDNLAKVNAYGFKLHMSFCEARDFARHRSLGRYIPLFSSLQKDSFLDSDFTLPLYLTAKGTPFKKIANEFTTDMRSYLKKVNDFALHVRSTCGEVDPYFLTTLLPVAINLDFYLHGSPKEFSYLVHQRVRPGGHINYRDIAYQIGVTLAKSDPLLDSFTMVPKPKPFDPSELFDRS